jgi:CRP/FNR family transcriptional regulator, cyclic AMP receptor protein
MNVITTTRIRAPLSGLDLEAVFGRTGWLADASPQLRQRLLAGLRPVPLARGERLFAIGDGPGGIFGVVSGGIAVEGSVGAHQVRTGHILRAGAWLGFGPVMGADRRMLGFYAIERSQVVHLPLPFLQSVMQENDELRRMLGLLSHLGSKFILWTALDLLIPEAPRRIAAVLLRVTGALEGVEPDHPHGFLLNQTMIGELANASRAHVNRVLGQLVEIGLIAKRYHYLKVLDPQGLAHFAYHED